MTDGIGPILTWRIVQGAGSAQAACEAGAKMLAGIDGIGSHRAATVAQSLRRAAESVESEFQRIAMAGARIVCRDDADYPPLLLHIPDPPPVLYVKGAIEPRDLNAVAIVGSRKCSLYGREQAERFAALLAGAGVTVVSGGARGIDSSAHRGAMQHAHGRTIAVLGSGIDMPYPAENVELFERIASRGAVVTEFPMGTAPTPENFPRRNRIVSGMSRGVLVIEADQRSGALITARQAIEDHGRPVFALPGRVDNAMSAGPHKLIRDGAVLVTGLPDILDNLGPLPQGVSEPDFSEGAPPEPRDVPVVELSESQRAILEMIGVDPVPVDAIIERTTYPAHEVLRELTFMSLRGLVRRIDGQTFARARSKT
ncbi:MAG: DNA-processing protein DprA [Tepidisphaeraceae bacterium]